MEKLFDKFINRIFGHYCMKRLKCRSLHNESVYRIISTSGNTSNVIRHMAAIRNRQSI